MFGFPASGLAPWPPCEFNRGVTVPGFCQAFAHFPRASPMRSPAALIAAAICVLACFAGGSGAQTPRPENARRTQQRIKEFAREELDRGKPTASEKARDAAIPLLSLEGADRGELTFSEPRLSKTSRSVLSFSFGEVSGVAFPELELQLRVELLSRYPVFGKDLIEPLVPKLEAKIIEFIPLEQRRSALASQRGLLAKPSEEEADVIRRQRKITDAFDSLLVDLARAYADKHELLLPPEYALAPGTHYHIAGRVVAQKNFSHDDLKALVRRYFDKGPLDYHAPQVTITSEEGGRYLSVGNYDIGALPSNPTLAAQFTVELFRRHPALGERFLRPRLDAIEKVIAKQLGGDRDGAEPSAAGRPERPDYASMFNKIFEEYAAENALGFAMPTVTIHRNDSMAEVLAARGGITVKAAANVKTITFVPGLVYRYAEKTRQAISPLHTIVTKPGHSAALEVGKYVYRLEFKDGTLSDYRPLTLPSDLEKRDPPTLHIPSDPDEKGRPGAKPDEKRRGG
jgi:hypothetical protein